MVFTLTLLLLTVFPHLCLSFCLSSLLELSFCFQFLWKWRGKGWVLIKPTQSILHFSVNYKNNEQKLSGYPVVHLFSWITVLSFRQLVTEKDLSYVYTVMLCFLFKSHLNKKVGEYLTGLKFNWNIIAHGKVCINKLWKSFVIYKLLFI